MTRTAATLALLAVAGTLPTAATAQEPDSAVADTVIAPDLPAEVEPVGPPGAPTQAPDTATPVPVSPAGAMVRSMVLPGWGQAKFDAYFRGGIYYAGWAGNWYMIFRNAYRLDDAQTRYGIRQDQLADELIAASPNPDSMAAQIDSFPSIVDAAIGEDSLAAALRGLVGAREQQQEDWIAWSLFWVLASGIDALVTAHLADFPAEVRLRPGAGRGVSLEVGVPFPGRPRSRRER